MELLKEIKDEIKEMHNEVFIILILLIIIAIELGMSLYLLNKVFPVFR